MEDQKWVLGRQNVAKVHVLHDAKTKDIDFGPVEDRTWKPVREAFVQFGGSRTEIKTLISDETPEFNRAATELGIGPITGTPGRRTPPQLRSC